ncbi:histone-lysine N-methyltransferase SETMAR [Trichonephila clavipes]|nr:histone-lysine N-methyltransferase SETMAR [Trichonephila clavipes]
MAKFSYLPENKRYKIIHLKEEGYSMRQIAAKVPCGLSTVVKTLKRFSETNSIADRGRSGRPRKHLYVKTVPGEKGGGEMGTSTISPNLNPPDFFLFPRLKFALKRKRFDHIPDIQRNITRFLNYIPKEDFLLSFQNMYSTSQRCIVMEGDYFEGQQDGPQIGTSVHATPQRPMVTCIMMGTSVVPGPHGLLCF